jgi:hypothetical protein
VHKLNKSYTGVESSTPEQNRFGVFSTFASDLGCINSDCSVNFNNDLVVLSTQGLGKFTPALNSGGIDAMTYQYGVNVNSLIQEVSSNGSFGDSWAIHCPARQLIWFNMPSSRSAGVSKNGYRYPSTPMGLSICLHYGVQLIQGAVVDVWCTRSGAGWGFNCGFVDGEDMYLGSYYGDVYKCFASQEYERKPDAPNTRAVVKSTYKSGDLDLDGSFLSYKQLQPIFAHFFITVDCIARIGVAWNLSESYVQHIKSTISSGVAGGLYDTALYNEGLYAFDRAGDIRCTPTGGGEFVRFNIDWYSQVIAEDFPLFTGDPPIGNHNIASLFGIKGVFNLGGRSLT